MKSLFFIALVGCAGKEGVEPKNEVLDGALTSYEQIAPLTKLSAYQGAAHAGSGAAANSVSTFYMKADKSGNEEFYWLMISAENGDPVGQYNLAMKYLDRSSKFHSKIRAKFWLEKAAKLGDKKSNEALDKLNQK
ncbi:hypothetical protein [Luteimonas aquatica]|uniref:hypothetical protein n=1 Tax=Luteimonas aquatica TaxID=450364 RepID=UPI001F57B419|nr:hypothetical protein [Luteimonas aquatica]